MHGQCIDSAGSCAFLRIPTEVMGHQVQCMVNVLTVQKAVLFSEYPLKWWDIKCNAWSMHWQCRKLYFSQNTYWSNETSSAMHGQCIDSVGSCAFLRILTKVMEHEVQCMVNVLTVQEAVLFSEYLLKWWDIKCNAWWMHWQCRKLWFSQNTYWNDGTSSAMHDQCIDSVGSCAFLRVPTEVIGHHVQWNSYLQDKPRSW